MSEYRLTEPIYVRASPEEKAALAEMAALCRLSLSRYLTVTGLGAAAPSKEVLLRWEMALFQLRRADLTLREIRKQLKRQKAWSLYENVTATLTEVEAALKSLGGAWSGK